MNIQEFDYEITTSEDIDAMQLGFVIIFGYSDNNAELRGAIQDEIGCYDGGIIYFDENGLLRNECGDDDCPYFKRLKQQCKTVEAVWDSEDYLWVYKTDIPHATFDIFEDGEKHCRGIVFRMEDLKQ